MTIIATHNNAQFRTVTCRSAGTRKLAADTERKFLIVVIKSTSVSRSSCQLRLSRFPSAAELAAAESDYRFPKAVINLGSLQSDVGLIVAN